MIRFDVSANVPAGVTIQDVVLSMLAVIVAPALQVADARNAFDDDGGFRDDALRERAELLVRRLVASAS